MAKRGPLGLPGANMALKSAAGPKDVSVCADRYTMPLSAIDCVFTEAPLICGGRPACAATGAAAVSIVSAQLLTQRWHVDMRFISMRRSRGEALRDLPATTPASVLRPGLYNSLDLRAMIEIVPGPETTQMRDALRAPLRVDSRLRELRRRQGLQHAHV
jgi:hypothetical protein